MSSVVPRPHWLPVLDQFERHWWAEHPHPHEWYVEQVPKKERAEFAVQLKRREEELDDELGHVITDYEKAVKADRDLAELGRVMRTCESSEMRDRVLEELVHIHFHHWMGKPPPLSPEEYRRQFPDDMGRIVRAFEKKTRFQAWRFHIPAGATPFASGGQAELFRVTDNVLDRPVVLKRVHGAAMRLSEDAPQRKEVERRIEREALTLAALNHPGVPAVYGHGLDGQKRRFLAMGWIDGHTLGDEVRAERAKGYAPRRTDPRFVAVVARLTDAARTVAAAHAHRHRIVHRDLTPKNVMIAAPGGPVFVIDWGLAFWQQLGPADRPGDQDSDLDLSRATDRCGTPDYISPEQAAGRTTDLGPPTDVFGLGAVLVYIATGKCVHDWASEKAVRAAVRKLKPQRPAAEAVESLASGAGLSDRIRTAVRRYWGVGPTAHVPAAVISDVRLVLAANFKSTAWPYLRLPGVNEELAHIVYRAVHPNPARRFANAGQLAEALEDWIQDAPARHPPPGVWNWPRRRRFAFGRWARRHTRLFLLAVAGVTALALLAAGVTHLSGYQAYQQGKAKVDEGLTRLKAVCDVTAEAAPLARQDEVRDRFLATASDEYAQFEGTARNAPAFRLFGWELLPGGEGGYHRPQAEGRLAFARVQRGAGYNARALELATEAVALFPAPSKPGERPPPDDVRVKAAACFLAGDLTTTLAVADPTNSVTLFEQAEERYAAALQLWQEVGDDKEQARVLGYRGDCWVQHAGRLKGEGRADALRKAKEDYDGSFAIRERLVKENPSDLDLQEALVHAHNNFGRLQTTRYRLGAEKPDADTMARHHREGKRILDELIAICERGAVPDRAARERRLKAIRGRTHIDLGEGYLACGDMAAARAEFDRAKGVFAVLKENPQIEYLTGYAWANLGCGDCLPAGERADSLREAERAVESLNRFPFQPKDVGEFERRYRH